MTAPVIDPEFEALIPPLAPHEREALRRSLIEAGGALSPVLVWRKRGQPDVLVDGHNRWRLCAELGLPAPAVTPLRFRDRAAVRAWMLEHQGARRALSREQLLILAVSRGLEPSRSANTDREIEDAREACARGWAADILAGRMTFRQARRRLHPPAPRAERPPGHEIAGVSTLTGPDGAVRAEWTKTRVAGAEEPPAAVPSAFAPKRISTMRRADGTTAVQWETVEPERVEREAAILEAWARHAKLYAGVAGPPVEAPACLDADLLTVYPLGDPHIGMLAWGPEAAENFDTAIACRELLACVRMLVAQAPPSRTAIITNLGDFLHAQDDTQRTPGHGHKLDVDGHFAKVLDAGHTVLRGIVEAALARHAEVRVRNIPGNHDPRVAAGLAMWLRAVFANEPRVVVEDAFAFHQYDRFGKVLIGWHHGDGTPAGELPAIMATDRAEEWGATTTRVWHCGHVHHLSRKESPGCVVETHRTLAARDAWHAARYRAGRSLQAITYHREWGEDARVTVGLDRVRAALTTPNRKK